MICSGKVYYDLLHGTARAQEIKDVAIVRLEQLYPFPENTLGRVLAPYRNADVVWCQEEPENMGAWSFVDRRHREGAGPAGHQGDAAAATSAARPRRARRPAWPRVHAREQATLVAAALGIG